MFEQRRRLVPGRSRAGSDDVIALERADRNAEHIPNPELRRQR
jgi:hypothetical protein